MRLTDFIIKEATVDDLKATGKEAAIRELVEALATAGGIKANQVSSLVKALMARERLGTTGIGRGVAVPHTKHSSVKNVVGVLGRSKEGVGFDALDREPVHIIFLLVSPVHDEGPKMHLKALEHISRLIRNETYVRFLGTAKDKEDLLRLVEEEDQDMSL